MTIRYFPKDPDASAVHRNIAARPGRPGATVRFNMVGGPPEQVYANNDENFLYWQVREAALQTLSVWDELRGGLSAWQNGTPHLDLIPNFGIGLQAEYDRRALRFYRWEIPGTMYVGASTDAVSHEIGHAILDALRPDLWSSPNVEILAFHEAFADCISLIVSLFDRTQRQMLFDAAARPEDALVLSDDLCELAPCVAHAYGRSFPSSHASATPRNANNKLQWQFPHTLRPTATGAKLSSEPHSFSRVFTGSFFDCIRKIYATLSPTSANLREATLIAGQLLIEAVENAPQGLQFYRAVGQSMVLADKANSNGANERAISDAFKLHKILLEDSSLVETDLVLSSTAPTHTSGHPVGLVAQSHAELRRHLRAPSNTRFSYRKIKLGAKKLLNATYGRDLSLGKLHKKLRGAQLRLVDSVLLDIKDRRHIVMDSLFDLDQITKHGYCLVETLLQNGMLMADGVILSKEKSSRVKKSGKHILKQTAAFSVRKVRGKKYITRIRCICHSRVQ